MDRSLTSDTKANFPLKYDYQLKSHLCCPLARHYQAIFSATSVRVTGLHSQNISAKLSVRPKKIVPALKYFHNACISSGVTQKIRKQTNVKKPV